MTVTTALATLALVALFAGLAYLLRPAPRPPELKDREPRRFRDTW